LRVHRLLDERHSYVPNLGHPRSIRAPHETVGSLTPALASIKASCEYMGGVSRAKFYADILPLLETVKLGSRNFVVVASMDRLIEANRSKAA
jgi:hypothetical protein